jgi:hypothetical protein
VVWDKEIVLYHPDSGDTHVLHFELSSELIAAVLELNEFDEEWLSAQILHHGFTDDSVFEFINQLIQLEILSFCPSV